MPLFKSNNGDISGTAHSRPVSVAATMSKLFEHYNLSCNSRFVANTDLFKSQWDEHVCIFTPTDCIILCKEMHGRVFRVIKCI